MHLSCTTCCFVNRLGEEVFCSNWAFFLAIICRRSVWCVFLPTLLIKHWFVVGTLIGSLQWGHNLQLLCVCFAVCVSGCQLWCAFHVANELSKLNEQCERSYHVNYGIGYRGEWKMQGKLILLLLFLLACLAHYFMLFNIRLWLPRLSWNSFFILRHSIYPRPLAV